MSTPQQIVQKLWSYCNVLRDDGLSYGDYVEQLTFLLFLKMADEQSRPPYNRPSPIPAGYGWDSLVRLSGDALEAQYRHTLEDLARRDKANLDIFWLRDESLEESANLPAPEVIAIEIVEDLQAALQQFSLIAEDLANPLSTSS